VTVKKGQRRKRYLLLSSARALDALEQKEVVRQLLQMYPDLEARKMVWADDGLIFRTDQLRLPEMKLSLRIRIGEVEMVPKLASGSISKLKRAAKSSTER
jgi:hypothetical protein